MLHFLVVQATADSGIEDEKRKYSIEGRAEGTQRLMPVGDVVIISSDNKLVPPLSTPSRDLTEEVRGRLGVGSDRGRDERHSRVVELSGRPKPNRRCMHLCIMT